MEAISQSELGNVMVVTYNNRGASVEELADRAVNKIISVGKVADPVLCEQAMAFREQIRSVIEFYMHEAIKADRTTQINEIMKKGGY